MLLALVLAAAAVLPARADELVVFAAASLTDALQEIGADYERTTGQHVVFSFGASNLLARQIREGAPADLFLSADEAKTDELEKRASSSRGPGERALQHAGAGGPEGSTLRLRAPPTCPPRPCAPGDRRALRRSGGDLRQAVAALARPVVEADRSHRSHRERPRWPCGGGGGERRRGIVYRTDAGISRKVDVAFEVPAAGGAAHLLPLRRPARARRAGGARALSSPTGLPPALEVFRKLGFLIQP
jgi:molybdate transport system substrate-binding protein